MRFHDKNKSIVPKALAQADRLRIANQMAEETEI
jgi:hypothetical protein